MKLKIIAFIGAIADRVLMWSRRYVGPFRSSWEQKIEQYVLGVAAKAHIRAHVQLAIEEGRREYRDHLRFVYRWISRLNGDKPHDDPVRNWKQYVEAIVYYPSSPWQTGDWFED